MVPREDRFLLNWECLWAAICIGLVKSTEKEMNGEGKSEIG